MPGSAGGRNAGAAVAIEIVPAGEEPGSRPCARVRVTPQMRLEGKQPEFVFELPLRKSEQALTLFLLALIRVAAIRSR